MFWSQPKSSVMRVKRVLSLCDLLVLRNFVFVITTYPEAIASNDRECNQKQSIRLLASA
jgi:hypothetical protein